jgi:tetratricopeptide (TPR) repeat protein
LYYDLDDAIKNMREAINLKNKILGADHTETSNSQLTLARFLIDREDYDEAYTIAQKAYDNIKNQLPKIHPYHAAAIGTLAKLKQKTDINSAHNLINHHLIDIKNNDHSGSKINLKILAADILLDQKNITEAKSKIDELRMMMASTGIDNGLNARLSILEGRFQIIAGDYNSALKHIESANIQLSRSQIEYFFLQRDKSAVLLLTNHHKEAAKLLIDVKNALKIRYNPAHSQIRVTCALLEKATNQINEQSLFATECAQINTNLSGIYIPSHLKLAL